MCELGLGPSAKNKEVKRPRLNPFLTEEKLDGTKIVDFSVGGMHTLASVSYTHLPFLAYFSFTDFIAPVIKSMLQVQTA